MEQLQTRILLAYEGENGGRIAYLYYREAFDLLNIEVQKYDKSQFIEIGQIIEFEGKRYRVKSCNFKMYEELCKVDNNIGTNLYSPTDLSDYNCQIGIFVENAYN